MLITINSLALELTTMSLDFCPSIYVRMNNVQIYKYLLCMDSLNLQFHKLWSSQSSKLIGLYNKPLHAIVVTWFKIMKSIFKTNML